MDEEIFKKTLSVLKFYYKEGVKISLRSRFINGNQVRGKITKISFFNPKYIILRNDGRSPIKIFVDEIELLSIMPTDYEKNKEGKIKRDKIPKALRYKILNRDRFTCQSCGARSPDVELEVDHIVPISKGGRDLESNLTTKCKDCNIGKGNKA